MNKLKVKDCNEKRKQRNRKKGNNEERQSLKKNKRE